MSSWWDRSPSRKVLMTWQSSAAPSASRTTMARMLTFATYPEDPERKSERHGSGV